MLQPEVGIFLILSPTLVGMFDVIVAAVLLTCLRLNMPLLFDRSICEISGAVPIKLRGGKTFSSEITWQSLLPFPRSFTRNIAPLVSLLRKETNNFLGSGLADKSEPASAENNMVKQVTKVKTNL